MTKDRRLGKGLAALLGSPLDEAEVEVGVGAGAEPRDGAEELLRLHVDEIDDNPFQPRRDFSASEIASLAESLKTHQMLQPVLVRKVGERYQLISGERRLRAAVQAGWSQVPARLHQADDRLVAELAIVENLQRKDLNPIEKALSFKRYLEQHQCTQEDLAQRLSIDRSTIANLVRLLELPEIVLEAVRKNDISAGHARALLPLGDEQAQIDFTRQISMTGMSVRATERAVQERIDSEDGIVRSPRNNRRRARSQQLVALEQELKTALGTKVEIKSATRGGKIIIHFSSNTEFERLRDLLRDGPSVGREAA